MGNFGDTLKALLHERGMSQAELARRIGLTSQAVSGWISSNITPARDNVIRVEEELGVPGVLLQAAGYSGNDVHPEITVESLLRADPGLSAEDKRTFLHLIRLARERFANQR